MKSLRILILTPTTLPDISGNAITAERWRLALIEKGVDVHVLATEGLDVSNLLGCIGNLKPHVIHAHHVSRAGALMLDPRIVDRYPRLPLVISPAGTDLYARAGQTYDRESIVHRVCAMACVIVTQGAWTAEKLSELFPDVESRILHIPKAVTWFGGDSFDLRKSAGWSPEHFVFFLPAGIRPVKRNLETLFSMKEIYTIRPRVRLFLAGPPLDQEYAVRFQEEMERNSEFVKWIPVISHGSMRSAYGSADVIINGSSSEGLSNAVLEAIAANLPILASDIPGNRWPILGGRGSTPCGLLFDVSDNNDFIRQALRLIDDGGLRSQLIKACRERAASWPGPEEEANGLIHAYKQAIERQQRKV